MDALRDSPDASADAPPPRAGRFRANGTTLYAEVRGDGPAVLIVPGGAEDAEGWRGVAERLPGRMVITYDRRGTLRSGRRGWPGAGSAQHADDAAALMDALRVGDVVVFGGSSAAIVALAFARRHPDRVRRVLAFEPGYLRLDPDAATLQAAVTEAIDAHLRNHPRDWTGAYRVFARATGGSPGTDGFLTPPPGREWYASRELMNAEPLVRDDIPILTHELPALQWLAATSLQVRFSHGTRSPDLFRAITERLAAPRGDRPDVIDRAGHALFHTPDVAADYILRWST